MQTPGLKSKLRHIREAEIDLVKAILPTGLRSLDARRVLKKGKGELVLIGGRPGHGKSALMFQIASFVARTERVVLFSLEMGTSSVKERLVAAAAKRSMQKLKYITPAHLKSAVSSVDKLKLLVNDDGSQTANMIANSVREANREEPVALVVVDYMQRISCPGENRAEALGDAALVLQALAVELKIPVVAGVQVNRQCEARGNVKGGSFLPVLGDIAESDKLGQHTDVAVFVSRPEKHHKDGEAGAVEINIDKNRDGAAGIEKIRFIKEYTTFHEEGCVLNVDTEEQV